MRKIGLLVILAFILALPLTGAARGIDPIVSADWLEKNLDNPKLVVVDIRKVEEYKEGHIPKSVNVFYGVWAIKKANLDNELPEADDLFDIIGSAGIGKDSLVVVAGKSDNATELVNHTRVAWTLIQAGVENVAVLDGAFNQWVKAGKPVSTEPVKPKAVEFKGTLNKALFASKDEVKGKIGQAVMMDTRGPEFFFGIAKLPFVDRPGHIKGAVSLPSAWMFTADGTYKPKEELAAMAQGVVGKDLEKDIVSYCDTGRLCSGWWFVLREALGYKNVKSYDGSMQEWGKDPALPMDKYCWR